MHNKKIWTEILLVIALLCMQGCEQRDPYLTVSEVWGQATELEGQRVRVRGSAELKFEPYHPLQVGGCSLIPADNAQITGQAVLFDDQQSLSGQVIYISEASSLANIV